MDKRWGDYFDQADQALQRQIRRWQILDEVSFWFFRLPIMLVITGVYLVFMGGKYTAEALSCLLRRKIP